MHTLTKDSLRIAFLCPFGLRPKATVSTRTLPMAQALCARGHQATLFIPPWDDKPNAGTRTKLNEVNIEQVSVQGGILPTVARIYTAVQRYHPDVLHLVKAKGYPAMVTQLLTAAKFGRKRIPIVFDADDWEGPGGWNDALPYAKWQKFLFARQEEWAYRHSDAVIVASEALRTLAWGLGVAPDKVQLVPNGLPMTLEPAPIKSIEKVRQQYNLSDEVVALYTRFVEFPPEWPAQFMAELHRLRPQAQLLVIGQGLRGEDESVQQAVIAAGLQKYILQVGWVGSSQLPAYLGACQTAIVPFHDNLIARSKCSVKLLELMSLGIPIVASAVGENINYLGQGEAGILISEGLSVSAWTDAVAALLGNPERRQQLSSSVAARLRHRYLWEALSKKVEVLYSSIV